MCKNEIKELSILKFLEALAPLKDTIMGILPLTAIMLVFQLLILKKPLSNVKDFILGIVFATLGLHFFLKGSAMSLIPLGDTVGRSLIALERKWLIIGVGFIIGYFGTLVEPALKLLALEVEEVSIGAIKHLVLIHAVAAGFGLGMGIGLYRILSNISYIKIIIPMLVIVIILSVFAPQPYAALAMDSASATTGPVNIPLNMALALGLAAALESVDPLIAGFGIIGLTSLGSMISVLVLGILTRF